MLRQTVSVFHWIYHTNRPTKSSFIVQSSVVWYLRYLDKYHQYQRFIYQYQRCLDMLQCHDTAKYRDITSFDTMQSLYCKQLLHTAWQQQKTHHIKACQIHSKHVF